MFDPIFALKNEDRARVLCSSDPKDEGAYGIGPEMTRFILSYSGPILSVRG